MGSLQLIGLAIKNLSFYIKFEKYAEIINGIKKCYKNQWIDEAQNCLIALINFLKNDENDSSIFIKNNYL